MNIIYQDLWKWDGKPTVFLVTTNSTLDQRGLLVAGKGCALEATKRIPNFRQLATEAIDHQVTYGCLIIQEPTSVKCGWGVFQTKDNWKLPSNLSIIDLSTNLLINWCKDHPDIQVRLPYPGIGCGGLNPDDVLDTINFLPDNVTVCRR